MYLKNNILLFLVLFLSFAFNSCNNNNPVLDDEEKKDGCDAKTEEWTFLGLENETITAIAVDHAYPNIIYAGTRSNFSSGINGKLFKSSDCGQTWDTLLIGGSYHDIVIDPFNHNRIYALPGSIIKSEDAGKTWQTIVDGIRIDRETAVQSLEINPKNSSILYAGTGGFFGGTLYKSYDAGMQWNEIGDDSLHDGVFSIAIDPLDTNNIYAGTAFRGILWKSIDAGNTWFRSGLGETGLLIHDVLIDTQEPSIIYVGLRGIYKSGDTGKTWEKLDQGLPKVIFDVVKISKYFSTLFMIGTFNDDGGIYKYSDLQNKWSKIGIDNLNVSYYYSDLKISLNPVKLYYGGKGIYVIGLK